MMLFLQMNALVVISFCLFWSTAKGAELVGFRSTPLSWLRWAQAILLLSILGPVASKLIPDEHLSQKPLTVFQAYAEEAQPLISAQHRSAAPQGSQVEGKTLGEPASSLQLELGEILFLVWALVTGLAALKFSVNYTRLSRLLEGSPTIKSFRSLKIVASEEVFVPLSVFTGRTRWVVIPVDLLDRPRDLHYALKHEIQHHRQGDTQWAFMMEGLRIIFSLNPFFNLWKKRITDLQEYSCDEALTGQSGFSSHEYGSCLLRVAEAALIHREVYVGTTSMAAVLKDSREFKTVLLRRIEMIMDEKRPRKKGISACTGLLTALVTMGVAFGSEILTRTSEVNSGEIVVDEGIQKITERVLARALKDSNASAGFAIVSDPSTGEILAVANLDLKDGRKGVWALSQLMEPATFSKTLVAAAALDRQLTTPTEFHDCENGRYKLAGVEYRDWKTEGWERLTTSQTIGLSSDICSIKIGQRLSPEVARKIFTEFGFGSQGTAKTFPKARPGEIPSTGPELIPQLSAGYGFRSSPLEIHQAYGAIANGGTLMAPVGHGAKSSKSIRRVISEKSSEEMRLILEDAVNLGTGKRHARSALYSTAGKTASSRLNDFKNIDWYGKEKKANFAGFIGFAPARKPRVQVFVGLMNPDTDKTGAHGGVHAAPVFRDLVDGVLTHLKVAPDKI